MSRRRSEPAILVPKKRPTRSGLSDSARRIIARTRSAREKLDAIARGVELVDDGIPVVVKGPKRPRIQVKMNERREYSTSDEERAQRKREQMRARVRRAA